jgi:hypothetical protein
VRSWHRKREQWHTFLMRPLRGTKPNAERSAYYSNRPTSPPTPPVPLPWWRWIAAVAFPVALISLAVINAAGIQGVWTAGAGAALVVLVQRVWHGWRHRSSARPTR